MVYVVKEAGGLNFNVSYPTKHIYSVVLTTARKKVLKRWSVFSISLASSSLENFFDKKAFACLFSQR